MKIKANQLSAHLKKQGLAKLYFVTGDEPLQMMESMDILRSYARSQGFSERTVLTVEKGFDWQNLNQQADNFSLFAVKRLLELQLGKQSLGSDGIKSLQHYVTHAEDDTVLFISADKLDASKQKTKWFEFIDKQGTVVQVMPIDKAQLPQWINQRMQQIGLQASTEAIAMIAERSEGHLLACAQEIEKLKLLHGEGHIEIEQVLEAVADSARYEVFDWIDTILAGNVVRCVRQLTRLRGEGVEAILLAWALTREIRNLYQMAYALKHGQKQEQVFKTFRVWQQRKNLVSLALKRHTLSNWQTYLLKTVELDKMIKGMSPGNPWDTLQRLGLQVSGVPL